MRIVKYKKLPNKYKKLLDEAERVMDLAYAPYSHFYVGAALLTGDGVFIGSNVESAAYVAICAERAAISAAVANNTRAFRAIAVISKSDYFDVTEISGPCGTCRQLLFEFSQISGKDIEVINSDTQKNTVVIGKISEFLPLSWGPLDTGVDIRKYK